MATPQRRMPRKRQFPPRRKNPHPIIRALIRRLQQKRRLAQIRPIRERRHLRIRKRIRPGHHRQRIAFQRRSAEHINLLKQKFSHQSKSLDNEASKYFFFEKKKQKTLALVPLAALTPHPQDKKFFGYFFSKK
jgi:hypothetical protein